MPDASRYHLRVTAGPSYDPSTHQLVHVNTPTPVHISSSSLDAQVAVRISNFRGLPRNSPTTSDYFAHAPHTKDLYSIGFAFSVSKPIPGDELVFGNDFDHPINKNLPPGFGTALRIVRWGIDPGLDGDVYAEKPYLYGPLLSSINVLHVEGDGDGESKKDVAGAEALEEGGTGKGAELRQDKKVPEEGAARMKHFLDAAHKADWSFEPGYTYKCDFFNPYLDFNEFSLKLPGFTLPIMKFWDGQPLRYTLKHRTADGSVDEVLMVVLFTLIPEEEVEADEKKWVDGKTEEPEPAKKEEPSEQNGGGSYVDEGVD